MDSGRFKPLDHEEEHLEETIPVVLEYPVLEELCNIRKTKWIQERKKPC